MAGVGNDQFAIVTQPLARFDAGVRIDLPVTVSVLSVRAEEAGRDQLDAIVLRPIALAPKSSSRAVARRAVRYGESNTFFIDDRSYPEPAGFWVAGRAYTEVVIAPDHANGVVTLIVQNGAAANVLTLESPDWRTTLPLAAGEERRAEIPLAAPGTSLRLRIRSASGFRPADLDHASRDTRTLGAFVRVSG